MRNMKVFSRDTGRSERGVAANLVGSGDLERLFSEEHPTSSPALAAAI